MKTLITTLAALAAVFASHAQTLNVVVGNVTYAMPASLTDDMTYTGGTKLTIIGKTFNIADITRIYVDNSTVDSNTVNISYNDSGASVVVAGNIAQYITPTISESNVTITQSDLVSDNTCGEITYALSGTSANGSFTLNGSYKASIELNAVSLTSTQGAALNLQDGKRISLSIKKDTKNSLADAASGSQKGCIACKGHLEIKGKGVLNIHGNAAHAIYAKEYVTLKNATVNILSAAKDGVNCNQYFAMESGTLSASGVQDDGLQVSYKDDTDRESEDTGSITISGGTVDLSTTATAAKGMKTDGNILVSDGNVTITTSGGGKWDSDESKTKASSCLSADGKVQISGGTIALSSSGGGGKGISCDGEFVADGGTICITTTGGMYAYVNGTEYPNYSGNTDRLSSNQKSSPKGIKADGNVNINGGSITVNVSGNGGEGIESKSVMTITDGTIVANTADDALNSSSHMYIKGGNITVVATGNDGLDSNGNMYIEGGTIMAFGTTSPECGIDANEEDGYSVIFTGGTLLAVGGGNSVPTTSASTQPYVSSTVSVSANSAITLKNGETTLASFTVPSNYTSSGNGGRPFSENAPGGGWGGQNGSSVLITCPGLTSGSSYTMTCGSTSSSVTARLTGSGSGRPL